MYLQYSIPGISCQQIPVKYFMSRGTFLRFGTKYRVLCYNILTENTLLIFRFVRRGYSCRLFII